MVNRGQVSRAQSKADSLCDSRFQSSTNNFPSFSVEDTARNW